MKFTKTTLSFPGEEPVPAIGVEITEPDGEERLSFAISATDLHRALLMTLP